MAGDTTALFDPLAADYDATFSERLPAQWLRGAVHARIAPLLAPGSVVLDAGCGTGVDAVWLAEQRCKVWAGDTSQAMLEVAHARAAREGLEHRIRFSSFDLDAPERPAPYLPERIDLILSNFGALNCVARLEPFFEFASRHVAPDGFVAVTVMGRFCLVETLRFLAAGDLKRARRRWGGRASFAASQIRYHSPRSVLAAARGFERHSLHGIGALVPPSELFAACERHPRLLRMLATVDRGLSRFTHPLSDHYLLILRRHGEDARP